MYHSTHRSTLTSNHPTIGVAASLILLAGFTSTYLFAQAISGSTWILIWFVAAGLTLRPLTSTLLNPQRRRTVDWTKLLFIPIALIFFFSRKVYPKLEASWGGGQPVPVVLFLTRDSPLRPAESLPALLLDESESGFYFVEETKSQAVFLPRAQVSMLVFSDKPLPTSASKSSPSPPDSQPQAAKQQPPSTNGGGPTAPPPKK